MTELEYLQGIFECGVYIVGFLGFFVIVTICKYAYKFLKIFF